MHAMATLGVKEGLRFKKEDLMANLGCYDLTLFIYDLTLFIYQRLLGGNG